MTFASSCSERLVLVHRSVPFVEEQPHLSRADCHHSAQEAVREGVLVPPRLVEFHREARVTVSPRRGASIDRRGHASLDGHLLRRGTRRELPAWRALGSEYEQHRPGEVLHQRLPRREALATHVGWATEAEHGTQRGEAHVAVVGAHAC